MTWPVPIVTPVDPNDIVPPASVGESGWIKRDRVLPFMIRFENDPDSATAPVQAMWVEYAFPENVDISSFELGDFGFGDFYISVPDGTQNYSTQVDATSASGLLVNFEATISNNKVTWYLQSIDPATGEPPTDALAGFLPVNNPALHDGEGFINFRIRPNPNSQTFDVIQSQAAIIFDTNDPVLTPIVINTIDADPPESQVLSGITAPDANHLRVRWEGTDIGVGLENYTIFYAVNDSTYVPWKILTGETESLLPAELGNTYHFQSIARDSVGNVEPAGDFEVEVIFTEDLIVSTEDLLNPQSENGLPFVLLQNHPNPFSRSTTIEYELLKAGKVQLTVFGVLGRELKTWSFDAQQTGRHEVIWNGRNDSGSILSSGVYYYQLRLDGLGQAKSMILLR